MHAIYATFVPMEKSVTFTGACANEIIPSITRSFVYKAKEGGYVRICVIPDLTLKTHIILMMTTMH